MNAKIGDMVHIHGRTVGAHERVGKIVEVRGRDGSPPYLVRFEDGHETLIFPGPDCVVEHLVAR
jgi:hypothetical protein